MWTVFAVSFFAIIPLAKLLAFATDELSLQVGQTLAGLLNATFVGLIYTVSSTHLTDAYLQGNACVLQ